MRKQKEYYWFGIKVKIANRRKCKITGLKICDLIPEHRWPVGFFPAKTNVVISLLRKEPRPNGKPYHTQYEY